MSATKTTKKWAAGATLVQLHEERLRLLDLHRTEKNAMVRSSLSQRLAIVEQFIAKRRGESAAAV